MSINRISISANSDFRAGVSALNLPYVVGIQSTPSVWPPGQAPLPPKPWSGRGRRPCNVQRDDQHKPVSVKDLALSLGKKAWRSVTWREGSNAPLASRFAAVRVHLAARDYKRTTPHRSNGCSSNGRRERRLPRNTGFP